MIKNLIISFCVGAGIPMVLGYVVYKLKENDLLEIIDKLLEGGEKFREAEELADARGIGIIPERWEVILDKVTKAFKRKVDNQLSVKERELINKRLENKGYLVKDGKNTYKGDK